MYTFFKEDSNYNKISTESVKIDFDQTGQNISLKNAYPVSDKEGITDNSNRTTFKIKTNITSKNLKIGYDLGLIDIKSEGRLKENYIKIALLDQKGNVVLGKKDGKNNLVGGILISDIKEKQGKYNLIDNYCMTSDVLKYNKLANSYTLIAYISSEYDILKNRKTEVASEKYNFSFKINLIAKQL